MKTQKDKATALRQRFASGELIVAPGVFDLISVRLADRMNFDCLYMTGFGTVASALGEPDAGLASYRDMVDRVGAFCAKSDTPMICDGDTGYGGLLNVAHTVRGYEAAGAAGIQLEDQEFPKKCGHTQGRRVIPAADMVDKIHVAVEARQNDDTLIVARTDARTVHGLDEALRRGEAYVEAGADVLFIESPETEAELETIGRHFDVPLLNNIVEGGRTPQLTPDALQALGFSIAIYPATGFLAATRAMAEAYGALGSRQGSLGMGDDLYDFTNMCKLMGFEEVWAFERAHPQE